MCRESDYPKSYNCKWLDEMVVCGMFQGLLISVIYSSAHL